MGKRKNKSETPATLVEAAAAALVEAQTDVPAGPIDHGTQFGSWSAPEETPADPFEGIAAEADALEAQLVAEEEALTEELVAADVTTVDELMELEAEIAEEAPILTGLEADTLAEELTTEDTPVQEVQDPEAAPTFRQLLDAVTEEQVMEMVVQTATALDERAAFEEEKNPDNQNIQRTLKKARAEIVTKAAARVMVATNVDPSIFNRSIHEGNRYNVYAIGKFADVVKALGSDDPKAALHNAINNAVMRSLFRFRAAGETFTGELARAACSMQWKVPEARLKAHLVRHTVSTSTAPTQASSTMQALQSLSLVKAEGSTRNPNYHVIEGPLAERVAELLAA